MNQVQPVTFTWRQVGRRARSTTRAVLPWAVTGVVVAAALIVCGRPGGAVFVVALAASRLTFLITPEVRSDVVGHAVVFHRQRWSRNRAVWIAVAVAVMGASIATQVATGELGNPLVLMLAAALAVAAAVLFVVALRFGGPIEVSADGVSLQKGRTFRFDTDRIVVRVPADGDPVVELRAMSHHGDATTTATISRGVYGLDANAVVSAVEQIRAWSEQGRRATPWEICAMMTATPPRDVPEGASVQLTVEIGRRPVGP